MRKRERTGERGKLLRPRCRPDPQEKRQELQDLPAVPRGHLVISPEELQATLDVAGRTVLSYMHQLLCAD